jgi:metallo-beta-lactamase class B
MHRLLLITTFVFSVLICRAQQINEPQGNVQWSQPYEPFRIVGNVYYVGTYDLACYLITTPKGHILINSGLAASGDLIGKNIQTLGFKESDLKILTTTQAHYDHVGALASLKKLTGAKMYADSKDADVLEDGGKSDYEMHGRGMTFAPVTVDRKLDDNDVIEFGGVKLTMIHHPGHTKGSCSFLIDVKDEGKNYRVLIANMPTIVTDRKLSEIPEYPGISGDIAYTLASLKKQKFDIYLSSHASQFDLHKKHKPGDAYNPQPFVDRVGYDEKIAELEAAYQKKMQQM